MENKKVFTLGSVSISKKAREYIDQTLDSTFIGPFNFSNKVAQATAKLHNYQFGHYLNSGQSALTIALRAIKRKYSMERPIVLTPAITYISTQASCYFANCDIGLVDVNLEDGNMNFESLTSHLDILDHLRDIIVMPVHLAGKPCDKKIFEICQERNIPVVVDSCEMFAGAKYGVDCGDIICLSTFSNHHVGAGGGGITITNDPELDVFLFQQINHGRLDDRQLDNTPENMAKRFRFDSWGESLKPNDLTAAVALAQIEDLDQTLNRYIENAKLLTSLLPKDKFILPEGINHTYMFYPIVMKDDTGCSHLVDKINKRGVFTRAFMPITNQEVILDNVGVGQSEIDKLYSNAAYLNRNAFYVGVHPELTLDDMEEMGGIIFEAIKKEGDRVNS